MRETIHTPGPWQIIQADTERMEIDTLLVRATGAILMGRSAKKLTCEGVEGGEAEFMANLCLIAAAPDLLEALEAMMAMHAPRNGEIVWDGPYEIARDAIAKAKAA
jgi:hypothetical protein